MHKSKAIAEATANKSTVTKSVTTVTKSTSSMATPSYPKPIKKESPTYSVKAVKAVINAHVGNVE